MSDEVSANGGPFDLGRLKELVEIMKSHDLTEVTLERGDEKWCLRRGSQETVNFAPGASYMATPPAIASVPQEAEAAEKQEPDKGIEIKSPTVGTFYSAPTPDDPSFVNIGTAIQPDTIVCIVEAMKVFNQIPAEVSGTIAEVLVKNGDSVEFGQPLFRVRPV